MSVEPIDSDRLRERILLLKRFLPHLEWPWPNEVKTKISQEVFKGELPTDRAISIEELAQMITDGQLEEMIQQSSCKYQYSFRGKYYTVRRGGIFEAQGACDEVRQAAKQVLEAHGKKGYALLKALTEMTEANFERIAIRASEIYGERFYPSQLIARLRDKWDLVWEVGSRQYPRWAMPEEVKGAIVEVLSEFAAKPVPKLSTTQAEREFQVVIRMEEEFKAYLRSLLKDRLEDVIAFGKDFTPLKLIKYLQDLYGPVIFYDHLLSITQQYSICDAEVISLLGYKALKTGFNLALFGEPGTGKTFATKDMIMGNEDQGVPPHGLPGLNRYCGGMTPAMFIAIGEAYYGRKYNFIVTEFNDWFKYKGMVEPLKLALERGTIQYETKTYTVGPYKFDSFFSVNYNTRVYERGYEVTVQDPNFNAIEDRMLCRLHRLTKEKYQELSKSQMDLMLGMLRGKMEDMAPKIRDHLTLLYAIQTREPLVTGIFPAKNVLLTEKILGRLKEARNLILENLGETESVPFSTRLERRALQLASAMSLINYFSTGSDMITIDDTAANMAVQFFVEEAWVRSKHSRYSV